jgi:hypothetical protein
MKAYGRKKMQIKRINTSVMEAREQELLRSDLQRQSAMMEYIALMADVELPDDAEREGTEYEQ